MSNRKEEYVATRSIFPVKPVDSRATVVIYLLAYTELVMANSNSSYSEVIINEHIL